MEITVVGENELFPQFKLGSKLIVTQANNVDWEINNDRYFFDAKSITFTSPKEFFLDGHIAKNESAGRIVFKFDFSEKNT